MAPRFLQQHPDRAKAYPPMSAPLFSLDETRLTWIVYSLAIGVAALVFFFDLAGLPFDMDDESYLQDSAAISKDFSAILSPSRFQGRPVVNLVFWAGCGLWGESSSGFHLTVVFFHVLASLLLAKTARSTGATLETAFLAGLLFLVNVAHFRAVYWIAAVAYPLALALSLSFVLCYLQYLDRQKPVWLVGAYVSLSMAVFAHPANIAAWLFCLFLAWRRSLLRPALSQLVPLGVLLAAAILGMIYFYPDSPPIQVTVRSLDFLDLAQQFLWFCGRLLTTAHWLPLSIYSYDPLELIPGVLVLAGFVVLLWRGASPCIEWAVWTFTATLPFLTVLPSHVKDLPQGGPSRFIYLASAGTSVLIAWGLQRGAIWLACKKPVWGYLAFFVVLSGLLVSSFISLQRLRAFSYYTAGRNSIALGDIELGTQQLQRALAQDSGIIPLLDAYSRLCLQLMGTAELGPTLHQALEHFPADPNLNLFQSVDLSLSADPVAIEQARSTLISLVDTLQGARRKSAEQVLFQAYSNYGLNRTKQDDFNGAVPAYRHALEYNPGSIKTYWCLVIALVTTRQTEEAISMAEQALRLTSDDPSLPGLRALVLRLQGRVDEAILACQDAIAEYPVEDLFSILGECYEQKGELEQARQVYQQCLALFPHSLAAHQRLNEINTLRGDRPSAIQE